MPFVTRVASRVLVFSCSRGRSRFRTDGRTVPVYKPRRDGTARPQNFRASTILWHELAIWRNHDIDISLWYKLFGLRHAANACPRSCLTISGVHRSVHGQFLRRTRRRSDVDHTVRPCIHRLSDSGVGTELRQSSAILGVLEV